MSHVSSPSPTPDPWHRFMNLFPKGEWHPFLYKLSYLIYYLTQLFHLLWNLISPYLRQICWHLFYYGRGPPIQNFMQRIAMGPWGHGVILSLSRAIGSKSTQEQSVSMIHLKSVSFKCLVGSLRHPRISGAYIISTWYLELYIPVELSWLQRQGRCLILCWLGTWIWGLVFKADSEPLHLLFQFRCRRPPPILRRYISVGRV